MADVYITSEDDFLSCINTAFPNTHESLILGRGDDCAEIACPESMAVSTDLFVEDVHFRRTYFTPEEIGYKALAVNISDIAAAGGHPLGISVGLVIPTPFTRTDAEGIISGMKKAVEKHGLALTGGDLSRGDKLTFCVTIWGSPEQGAPFLRRGPVTPGDILFVYGGIGLAKTGLTLLERHGRDAIKKFPAACAAHLMPTPQIAAGKALSAIPGCRVMDVSDGLARDLPRMLKAYKTNCGATISLSPDVLHPEVLSFCGNSGSDPVSFAFDGGEDYALLGCCPEKAYQTVANRLKKLSPNAPLLQLGVVTQQPGIIVNDIPLTGKGFDHFHH